MDYRFLAVMINRWEFHFLPENKQKRKQIFSIFIKFKSLDIFSPVDAWLNNVDDRLHFLDFCGENSFRVLLSILPLIDDDPLDDENDEPIEFDRREVFTSGSIVENECFNFGAIHREEFLIKVATKFIQKKKWKIERFSVPLSNCDSVIERSLIWFLLGLMSKHGLFPMPIDDISAMRISRFRFACFQSKRDISSIQMFFVSSDKHCRIHVSSGFRFRNQISNFVGKSVFAVSPMSDVFTLFL